MWRLYAVVVVVVASSGGSVYMLLADGSVATGELQWTYIHYRIITTITICK